MPVLTSGLLRYPITEALVDKSAKKKKKGLTGYDACYAALAEELEGTWLTFDTKAVQKVRSMNIAVGNENIPTLFFARI